MVARTVRRSSPYTAGFTLIELMIVIAIIATLAATVTPTVVEAARGSNESAAIGALRTVSTAQALYREGDLDGNGIHDYAATLDQLAQSDPEIAALFGPDPREDDGDSLGGPSVLHCCFQGYYFAVLGTQPPPAAAFRAVAVPLSPATGKRVFAADETELILAAIGHVPVAGDEVIDPGTGAGSACGAACNGSPPTPIPTQADLDARDTALLTRSRSLVLYLDQISDGEGIPGAQTLLGDPSFQTDVLDEIDVAQDGVSADDATGADLVALAQTLTPPGAPPGPVVMDDAAASAMFAGYQSDIAALLDLSLYQPHPSVPLTGFTGDPLAFLASLSGVPLFGVAGFLLLALAIALVGSLRLLRPSASVRTR